MVAKPPNTAGNEWDKGPNSLTHANTTDLSAQFGPLASTQASNESAFDRTNRIELEAEHSTKVGTVNTDERDNDDTRARLASLRAAESSAAILETQTQLSNKFSQRDYSDANGDVFGESVFTNEDGVLVDAEGRFVSHNQLTQIGDNDGVCYNFRTQDGDLTNDMLEYFTLDYEEGMDIDQSQIPEHIQAMVADIDNPTVEDYENAAHEYLSLGATDNATILDVPTSQISAYFTDHANFGDLIADRPEPVTPQSPALDTLDLD